MSNQAPVKRPYGNIWEMPIQEWLGNHWDQPIKYEDPLAVEYAYTPDKIDADWRNACVALEERKPGAEEISRALHEQPPVHENNGYQFAIFSMAFSNMPTCVMAVAKEQGDEEWKAAGEYRDNLLIIKRDYRGNGLSYPLIRAKFKANGGYSPNPDRGYSSAGRGALLNAWKLEVEWARANDQQVPPAILQDYANWFIEAVAPEATAPSEGWIERSLKNVGRYLGVIK
ncbi:hypothetical protein ABNQ39_37150 (plasmid) [Azospirillum sp. A26]|uniref:hypothetical protein n=1 Tax=Azospirillum sp. A26 TaxID=3160607 RepID=UPI0036720483